MSGLILPKHWRFNWPLLMGHLGKIAGGHLTKNASGHLVKCNNCFCSAIPSSITLSGATGCLAVFNGTFAQSLARACSWTYDDYQPSPTDPCGVGCAYGASERYWPEDVAVGVTLYPGDGMVKIYATSFWRKYTWSGGVCSGPSGSAGAGSVWTKAGCTDGAATFASAYSFEPHLGTHPTSCTIAF